MWYEYTEDEEKCLATVLQENRWASVKELRHLEKEQIKGILVTNLNKRLDNEEHSIPELMSRLVFDINLLIKLT